MNFLFDIYHYSLELFKMEGAKVDEKVALKGEPAENTDPPIGEDQQTKHQSNENDNDDAIVYHSLMNAAPETQEEKEFRAPEGDRGVQLEPEPELEEPELEPESEPEPKLMTETIATSNFDIKTEELGQHDTIHPESQHQQPAAMEERPENIVEFTDDNVALPISSIQEADENIFKSSVLSQSSVDAQMEKVIDDIVELGGCQQFGQTLEQHGCMIDKEKEVQNIQREIIGDGNLNIKTHETMEAHSKLNEKEQHSQIEAEKPTYNSSVLPQITDLSALQEANLEQNEEEKEKQTHMEEVQEEVKEQQEKEPQEKAQQTKGDEQHLIQHQQQSLSPIVEPQRCTNEGQQLPENPSSVDEPQPLPVSKEKETLKISTEDRSPKEINNTARAKVDSNVTDSTKRDLQDFAGENKVIPIEEDSSEQQIEKPERRQRRGSSKKIASPVDQSVEENKIEETEPEVRVERRSSRRIKLSNKAKDEEAEEPPKPTRRKKEENDPKVSKVFTADKDVPMNEEPENEPREVKSDDSTPEVEKPARGVRGSRITRKSTPVELPKVKLERKPLKRSLEKDDSHDKSIQPMIKTPSRSAGSSARSITAHSATKIDHSKSRLSSDFDESKKYHCGHCSYSTDRLNNIVYHKKALCSYAQQHFNESVEKYKQTLQSPKTSNNKRSSR